MENPAIESQLADPNSYLQRMLYGTAKILTESLDAGMTYGKIARVV